MWKNSIEIVVDTDGVLWLNEKHKKEGLHNKNLRVTPEKYLSIHRKYRCELVEKPKKIQKNYELWNNSST